MTPAQRAKDDEVEKVFREFADDRILLGWDHSNLINTIDIPWICGKDHESPADQELQAKVLKWMLEKKVKMMMMTYKDFVDRSPPADANALLFASKEFADLHAEWKWWWCTDSFGQASSGLSWTDVPASRDWARVERWPKFQEKQQRPGDSFAILPGPPRRSI